MQLRMLYTVYLSYVNLQHCWEVRSWKHDMFVMLISQLTLRSLSGSFSSAVRRICRGVGDSNPGKWGKRKSSACYLKLIASI